MAPRTSQDFPRALRPTVRSWHLSGGAPSRKPTASVFIFHYDYLLLLLASKLQPELMSVAFAFALALMIFLEFIRQSGVLPGTVIVLCLAPQQEPVFPDPACRSRVTSILQAVH
jgi:hypothetical protein